jgi:two-component system chemotaxis response regulator CheB
MATSDCLLNAEEHIRDVVVLGASAGGVEAMIELLRLLPGDLPAVLALVIHRPPEPSNLVSVLSRSGRFAVVEAVDGQSMDQGCLYVAPPNQHLALTSAGLQLSSGAKEHSSRPAIDPLFRSAANLYGARVMGVILSGCGRDGTDGLAAITHAGGVSVVQDPNEAGFPYMPEAAIAGDHPDAVLTIAGISRAINEVTRGHTYAIGLG